MTTQHTPTPTPDPAPTPATAPGSVSGQARRRYPGLPNTLHWALLALGVIGEIADIAFTRSALELLLLDQPLLCAVIALVISITASAAAIHAGISHANHHPRTTAVLAGAWAGLGAALAIMRWNLAELISSDGTATIVTPAGQHIVAVLMAVLYTLAGLVLAVSAEHLFSTPARQWTTSRAKLRRTQRDLSAAEARYTRLDTAHTHHHHQTRAYQQRIDQAHHHINHRTATLKNHARLEIAHHLANPATTTGIRTPHQPTNQH